MVRLIPILILVLCGCSRRSEIVFHICIRDTAEPAYVTGCAWDLNTCLRIAESRTLWEKNVAPKISGEVKDHQIIHSSLRFEPRGWERTSEGRKLKVAVSVQGKRQEDVRLVLALAIDSLQSYLASHQPLLGKLDFKNPEPARSYDYFTGDKAKLYVYVEQ